jgi:hypothetical protein
VAADGAVQPCTFVHFSSHNARDYSLVEIMQSPFFSAIRAMQPYGVVNHKGWNDGYRLYLNADQSACPNPEGTLTDPCLGFAVPGHSDQLHTSQYGSPARDPVTKGDWHHVVGTYDNTEMKLYVDGQKVLAAGGMGNHGLADGTATWGPNWPRSLAGHGDLRHRSAPSWARGTYSSRTRQGGSAASRLTKPDSCVTVSPLPPTTTPPQAYGISSARRAASPRSRSNTYGSATDQPQNVGWSAVGR